MATPNSYAGEDRRERERWKLKKEVSVPDIISFVSAALAVVFAYTTLDKRQTVTEQFISQQREVDTRQDAESLRGQVRIEAQFNTLSGKVDRILERVR